MSYSYIKSVFPEFESTNTNNKLFNSLNSDTLQKKETNNQPSAYDDNEMKGFAKSLLESDPEFSKIATTQTKLLEQYKNLQENSKDNLKFYNLPYIQQQKLIETFENAKKDSCSVDCEQYVKHIMECSKCKGIVLKQLNIESDRMKNEEMMELFSYIVFGAFILILLDVMKK